ncbi:hypothetical protein CHLNCDRAFT_141973 [Chlorella variabilis]|uniref:Uncharacterized protein n=1 Tax=Chlorella variabilis TaxID=554065 RepID=E1Z7F8_CHLVA|nr:hypothetical protein CHLNCDRAFT_141973 [Chlorella variabilis]EFN58163.1 hypothetical protein CHLNCDRAFT_141973 [Chlorella variabilis]|eukprot:XP_005850265.1 hypothetical protein CHLNCDRAFT_141973 [Chlorella variabilis]
MAVLAGMAAAQATRQLQQDPAASAPINTIATSNEVDAAVALQMVQAFSSASTELVTGESDGRVFAFAEPEGAANVNVESVAAKVFATALASWTMGVLDAPSNRGLKPSK